MTFPPQKPQPFAREAVAALRAGTLGCYGLFCRDRWIYVGTGDVRARLFAHLDGERPWHGGDEPTHWVVLETSDYETAGRELVLACGPVCAPASSTPIPSSGGLS